MKELLGLGLLFRKKKKKTYYITNKTKVLLILTAQIFNSNPISVAQTTPL